MTPDAADDLVAIWEYLADEDNEATADHVIRGLYAEFQKLSDMPAMGHYREDLLDRRHRFWNIWSHVIAYRWKEERPLPVISVIHGARNLDAFFARPRFKKQ